MNEPCFSIYSVEAFVGDDKTGCVGQGYHNFLAIVDETPGVDNHHIQEMHFIMKTDGLAEGQAPYMHAITKNTERNLDDLDKWGYIGGSADVILPIWNKALDIAADIGSLKRPFTTSGANDATNCRAGAKAVVEALGLEYTPVFHDGDECQKEGSRTGTESHIVDLLPEHSFDDMPSL